MHDDWKRGKGILLVMRGMGLSEDGKGEPGEWRGGRDDEGSGGMPWMADVMMTMIDSEHPSFLPLSVGNSLTRPTRPDPSCNQFPPQCQPRKPARAP
jgi:hypothetical protein